MITIHVGLHKTGSTSIQAALGLISHRRDLLLVPPGPPSRWSDDDYTRRLVEASRSRHVVVSDENSLGGMLEVYDSASDHLAAIRSALAGSDYEIVMYLRPQASWLVSAYLQHVQQGGMLSGSSFLEEMLTRRFLEWRALCGVVSQEGGARRVLVRAYVPSRDVVGDFFGACDLGPPPTPTPGGIRINTSISAPQATILRALNADSSVSPDEQLHMRRLFQGILASNDSGWSPFSQKDQDTIVHHFRPDWMALADMVHDVDPSEAQVFRESAILWDSPPLPYAGSSLSDPAAIAELLRCVRSLGTLVESPTRSILGRALDKVKQNPRDVSRSLSRALHRRS